MGKIFRYLIKIRILRVNIYHMKILNGNNPNILIQIIILKIKNDEGIGYIFEVDLKYPKEFRDKYSELFYCLENVIDDNQFPKLFATK